MLSILTLMTMTVTMTNNFDANETCDQDVASSCEFQCVENDVTLTL